MNRIYLNGKQLAFVQAIQKVKVLVGARGAGKSTVNGVEAYNCIVQMPRSKGFIIGLTYKQILDFILPSMIQIWGTLGLKEDRGPKKRGHYVIGKKPPVDWPTPYSPVNDFETAISFCNGSVIQLISFDRKNSSRGGSYDWGMFDEAALLNYDRLKKEILPSIRGNIYRFKSPRLHTKIFTTSMPWDPAGFWVPDMAEDAIVHPDKVFYIESTAHDNIEVLGEDYLIEAERTTDFYTFQVEYMNQRIGKMPNSFYDCFDANKHCYVAFEYEHNEDDWRKTRTMSSDYKEDKEFDVAFDFGGNFNCMLAAQDYIKELNEVKILRNLYVKDERKLLDNLIDDFCNSFPTHKRKHVNIYGDRNGNNKQVNSEYTLYQQIENKFRAKGWTTTLMVKGLDAYHNIKQITLNDILSEKDASVPKVRINRLLNKELIISIQAAGITAEFKKDKRSERQNIPQEKATHLSDAFDNYIGPKLGNYVASGGQPQEVFFGR